MLKETPNAIMCAIAMHSCATSLRAQANEQVMQTMAQVKWGDAPPILPAGAMVAQLRGNPGGEGLYTVRLLFPANYLIPAHAHPKDEHVIVPKGTMYMGVGDKRDTRAGKACRWGVSH